MKFWNKNYAINCVLASMLVIAVLNMYSVYKEYEGVSEDGQNFYITIKEMYVDQDIITYEDINEMADKFPELEITYANELIAKLSKGNKHNNVKVIGTNESYLEGYGEALKKGRFIVTNHYLENQIVLDENTAVKLFNTSDCIGEEVILKEEQYKVVGVVKNEGEDFRVYIPINKFQQYKEDGMKELFVKVREKGELEAKRQVNQMLIALGKEVENLEIIPLTKYKKSIRNKIQIVLGIIEISSAIFLCVLVLESIKKIYEEIKQGLKICYLGSYLAKNKMHHIIYFIKWIVVLNGASLLIKLGIEKIVKYSHHEKINIVGVNLPNSIYELKQMALFNEVNMLWSIGVIVIGTIYLLIQIESCISIERKSSICETKDNLGGEQNEE